MSWRVFRCLAIVGVLGLCFWTSEGRAYEMLLPACVDMLETGCTGGGATTQCRLPSGKMGACVCDGSTWWCGQPPQQ